MNYRTIAAWSFVGLLMLASSPAFGAVPVRKSSNNGADGNVASWNLFAPTFPSPAAGGKVTISRQVLCTDQDVASVADISDNGVIDDPEHAGTCLSGNYTWLYQVNTTVRSLTVTVSNLVGFIANTVDPNYGVAVCDDNSLSTLQLCTNLLEEQLPTINATINPRSTKVVFTVRNLGPIPAGIGHQGKGLTFVVLTRQSPSVPITVPKISIN